MDSETAEAKSDFFLREIPNIKIRYVFALFPIITLFYDIILVKKLEKKLRIIV